MFQEFGGVLGIWLDIGFQKLSHAKPQDLSGTEFQEVGEIWFQELGVNDLHQLGDCPSTWIGIKLDGV